MHETSSERNGHQPKGSALTSSLAVALGTTAHDSSSAVAHRVSTAPPATRPTTSDSVLFCRSSDIGGTPTLQGTLTRTQGAHHDRSSLLGKAGRLGSQSGKARQRPGGPRMEAHDHPSGRRPGGLDRSNRANPVPSSPLRERSVHEDRSFSFSPKDASSVGSVWRRSA